jgi:ABC-type amino acid transport substrate-binding protein
MNRIKRLLGSLLMGTMGLAFAQGPLLALYNPRPPYLVPDARGHVAGLTASPAGAAFVAAGVPFKWVEYPSERQLAMLKQDRQRLACVGWFKTAEREAFAKFSVPLYQDKQTAVLTRRDNGKVAAIKSVEELLRQDELTLLVKVGYSYGAFLDARIAQEHPRVQAVAGENVNMVAMIAARRADYMFIAPEEADAAIQAAGMSDDPFRLITFTDMPPGEKRYILYSRSVDDLTIERIDKGIKAYLARHR